MLGKGNLAKLAIFLCLLLLVFSLFFLDFLESSIAVTSAATLAQTLPVIQMSGSNQYERAVAVSKQGWKGAAFNVVIATGENYPDALAGAPLAIAYNAPILLTKRDEIPKIVKDEIIRLSPDRIFILGQWGVVSEKVEEELKKLCS